MNILIIIILTIISFSFVYTNYAYSQDGNLTNNTFINSSGAVTYAFKQKYGGDLDKEFVDLLNISESLTAEQISEVERDPRSLIDSCIDKFDKSEFDSEEQMRSCDLFMFHLQKKCEQLNYVPAYCGTGNEGNNPPFVYMNLRLTDLECDLTHNVDKVCENLPRTRIRTY